VHNGIDVETFRRDRAAAREQLRRELAIPTDVPLCATVAVLRQGKGIEVLIDAARRRDGVHFLIVGDGPMRAELTELARTAGVASRVHWAGFRNDVHTFLAGCDLFVHPSLSDAFPTVLLEAMAAGVPVVASNVGGVPEIVVPGSTGALVPAGDAERLASVIAAMLADPATLERMRVAAQERAAREFSTAAWISRLDAVYASVLTNR
jgi:glycosyltransferase involved in cell wall biosynthesis